MRAIILLMILALVLTACSQVEPEPPIEVETEQEVAEEVVEEEVEEEVVEEEPVEEEPVITCEEWAEELFPVQWVFKQDVTNDPRYERNPLTLRDGKWQDNVTIGGTSSSKVAKGSETGENINDYYTKPIYITIQEFGYTYNKQVIDEEGNILGVDTFKIRPVFREIHDKVEDEENSYGDTIQIRYLSLVIKEPGFVSCDKVD